MGSYFEDGVLPATAAQATGVLLLERGMPLLAMDGGGRWRLESTVKFRHLSGRRVSITGTRIDFDVLDISTITPV
jgi:hypothetical protein